MMHASMNKYLRVIKPGVVIANLLAVAGGFFLAARGVGFDAPLLLFATFGTGLVVASGCVLNNCIDRRIDRKMARTRNRVMARRQMSPKAAVWYASLLGVGGTVLLWVTTNLLCIAIVVTGFIVYVVVYSLWLKRTSVYSTLIGSLAGAAPPLVGYCAVTQRFDLGAAILLVLFSLWQMPHAYAIAVYRLKDCTAAAIPVLPVRKGIPAARKRISGYILAFTAAASMLTLGGYAGYGFLTTAILVGLCWLGIAWSGGREREAHRWGRRLFIYSIAGITVLIFMMSIDTRMPPGDVHSPAYCMRLRGETGGSVEDSAPQGEVVF